jgi:hypothetical protein
LILCNNEVPTNNGTSSIPKNYFLVDSETDKYGVVTSSNPQNIQYKDPKSFFPSSVGFKESPLSSILFQKDCNDYPSISTSELGPCTDLNIDTSYKCQKEKNYGYMTSKTSANAVCRCCNNQNFTCDDSIDPSDPAFKSYFQCQEKDCSGISSSVKGVGCSSDWQKNCGPNGDAGWCFAGSQDKYACDHSSLNAYSCDPGMAIFHTVNPDTPSEDGFIGIGSADWGFDMQVYCCDKVGLKKAKDDNQLSWSDLLGAEGGTSDQRDLRKQIVSENCGPPTPWPFKPIMGKKNNNSCVQSNDYSTGRTRCRPAFVNAVTNLNQSNFGF